MGRIQKYFAVLALFCAAVVRAEEKDPAKEFEAIKGEYDAARQKFEKAYQAAKTDEEREKAGVFYPQGQTYAHRVFGIAKKSPSTPLELEALTWVLSNTYDPKICTEAVDLLMEHQLEKKGLDSLITTMSYSRAENAEKFLRAVIEKNPDNNTKALATYVLAAYLKENAGRDDTKKQKEAEEIFESVIAKYPDVQSGFGNGDRKLADDAKAHLYEIRNLAIGKVAPDIEGEDVNGEKIKLSDYRGKVVVLDFWGDW
jgi:tetratricopeptide (TPR) repeat protein